MDALTLKKLEEAFAVGATDEQACFFANISHQTLYNYQQKNPEYVERKEALKKSLGLIAKNNLAKAINQGDVENAKWYLERKEKDEYSTKINNANEHSGGLNIVVEKRVLHAPDHTEL